MNKPETQEQFKKIGVKIVSEGNVKVGDLRHGVAGSSHSGNFNSNRLIKK